MSSAGSSSSGAGVRRRSRSRRRQESSLLLGGRDDRMGLEDDDLAGEVFGADEQEEEEQDAVDEVIRDMDLADGGKMGAMKKDRKPRKIVERTVDTVSSMRAAIAKALDTKVRNSAAWKAKKHLFDQPNIPDESSIDGKKITILDYIVKRHASKKRTTFKYFKLTDEKWSAVYDKLKAAEDASVAAVVGDLRDSVAEALGGTVEENRTASVKFMYRHAEAMSDTHHKTRAHIIDEPGAGADDMGDQLGGRATPERDETGAEMEDCEERGDPHDLDSGGGLGAGPMQVDEDDFPPSPGLTPPPPTPPSPVFMHDVDGLTPSQMLMLHEADEVLDGAGEDHADLLGDFGLPGGYDELVKPLTLIEVGDYIQGTNLLGVVKDMPVGGSEEAIKALAQMVAAGRDLYGRGHEVYGKLARRGCIDKMVDVGNTLRLTLRKFLERFETQMEAVAPMSVLLAKFILPAINEAGTTLSMTSLDALEARRLLADAEIPVIFAPFRDTIKTEAEKIARGESMQEVTKQLGPREIIMLHPKEVDKLNATLNAMLTKARTSADPEAVGNFYTDLMEGIQKSSGNVVPMFLQGTFIQKKSDLVAMPETYCKIDALKSIKHARLDIKTILSGTLPDDCSPFLLAKQIRAQNSPYLAHELRRLDINCKNLNSKQLMLLNQCKQPFAFPDDWVHGGDWDETAERMKTWGELNFYKRKEEKCAAAKGVESSKIVVEYAKRLAASKGMTEKFVPLALRKFAELVTKMELNKTDAGMAKTQTYAEQLRFAGVYMDEDAERKYRTGMQKFAVLQAVHAQGNKQQQNIKRGRIVAAKGCKK